VDMTNQHRPARLLRLSEVLARVPVGKSTIWLWVKQNRFPSPIKIGPRTTAWAENEVDCFIRGDWKGVK